MTEPTEPDMPLIDATDVAIVMHREVHFGGNFELMLDYYQKEGKGSNPEFSIDRIQRLAQIEQAMKQNLAGVILSGPDAERIKEAKDTYKQLRDLYEKASNKSHLPRLIADLILSEEDEPTAEMEAIVAEKTAIVPFLIDLLRAEDFHDPLFPGYGLAPILAGQCLGRIGDKRAIIALYEAIGDDDVFNEDTILQALHAIGAPAKDFLLRVVQGKPYNFDNERAAIALGQFKEDPEVAKQCFKLLKEIDIKNHSLFAEYLLLACEGLTDRHEQQEFIALSKAEHIPLPLRKDMQTIAKTFAS